MVKYYSGPKTESRFEPISEIDTSWLAGLLEGEGCFVRSGPRNSNGEQTVSVKVRMTDKDVVERAGKLMKCRNIRTTDRQNKKLIYEAGVFGNTARDVMKAVYPFMGERRKAKIDELLKR